MHVASTDDVPAGERFAFWREVSSRTWVPYHLRCEPHLEGAFQANLCVHDFGPVQVSLMTSTPYVIHRTDKLIRRDDPELYKLGIALHGTGTVSHDDRQAAFKPGDLVLYNTSQPYSAALSPDIQASRLLVLRFARELLPLPARDLERLTAVRIPGNHGVGALTSAFLLHLGRHFDEYNAVDATRLSTIALDLLTAALAHELDADESVPRQARHRALLAQVHAFIHQNLGDPALSPASIAAANHISLRHLHKLFQEQERTVAQWIRGRRLERCRRELVDPLLADRPINTIAARWGFASPAQFSQAFRAVFGISPRQYREQHSLWMRAAVRHD